MKHVFFIFFVAFSSVKKLSASDGPQVFFKYIPAFDNLVCHNQNLINPGEVEEMLNLLPQIQKAWDNAESLFFETTVNVVGKKFLRKEETATLFLCRDFPAMATPLLIWGYPFLKAARGSQSLDVTYIVPVVFHEILHLYVNDILAKAQSTLLLEKYKNESQLVRVHLHVFAIEDMVCKVIDPSGKLGATVRKMDESFGVDYERAWSIISNEGSQPFVLELHNI